METPIDAEITARKTTAPDDSVVEPSGAPPAPKQVPPAGRAGTYAAGALFGDAQGRSAKELNWTGNVDNNFGTINQTFGADAAAFTSFMDDLRQIDEVPLPLVPVQPELASRYAGILKERRVVVIVHGLKQRRDAVSAMYAVLGVVRDREQHLKRFASGFEGAFPLHSFYAVESWREEFQNSVIYLDRSSDATAFAFCDSDKRTFLRTQLGRMNSYLVVTVSGEGGARSVSCLDEGNWFVDAPVSEVASEAAPAFRDVFETTVVACAALLPGLSISEFVALVETLAPPPAATAEKRADDAKPIEPTREQRWRAGDRDRVLSELGITLASLTEEGAPAAGEAGLLLADEEQRLMMPGWLLTRFPLLLRQHVEQGLPHYFSPAASMRFRKYYLDLLFRLDALRVLPLTPNWLLNKFREVDRSNRLFEVSVRLTQLLVKALDSKHGESLVTTMLHQLVSGLIERERKLLDSIPEQSFGQALEAGAQAIRENADPAEAFWAKLIEVSDSSGPTQELTHEMLLVLHILIKTSPHLPATVAAELARAFSDSAVAGTRWAHVIGNSKRSWQVARLPRLALQWLLTQIIEENPLEWAAFSQMVVERFAAEKPKPATAARPGVRKEKPSSGSEVARPLAIDCLSALVDALADVEAKPLKDALYEYLTSSNERARAAQLLAKLIVQGKVTAADFIVSLFRSCATAFRNREGVDDSEVSDAVMSLSRPLRAAMASRERYAVSIQAREVQKAYLARRNYFFAIRDLEQASIERDHLMTMKIVIRAMSGATPQAAS